MQYKYLVILILTIMVLPSIMLSGQKMNARDSVWCNSLENIIRCVSMDQIMEPVGKVNSDSSFIKSFTPGVRLTASASEQIGKRYNKVTFSAYLYSSQKADKVMTAEFEKWYRKVKECLGLWEDAQLPNMDKTMAVYQDRFFTNSEDETAVRLDIVRKDGYHVRIQIY